MIELGAAIRFLHLTASLLLFGTLVFLVWIARPALARHRQWHTAGGRRCGRSNLNLAIAALLTTAFTGLAAWALQTAVILGHGDAAWDPHALFAVLSDTQYGQVWLLRVLLLGLLLAGLLWLRRSPDTGARALSIVALALAAAQLAALAFAGHAAAGEGPRLALQLIADSAHLLAAGAWLGGLPALLMVLRQRALSKPAVATVVRRYSVLGLITVSVLLLTGLINAWNLVDDIAPLFGTPYGRALLLKIALLLPLLAIAAHNLLRLGPALRKDGAPAARRHLQRNVTAEIGLGLAVLAIVGVLGVLPPARHVSPDWPFSVRLSWEATKTQPRAPVYWGMGLAAAGVLALGYARRRRYRPWALGLGLAGLSAGSGLALPALSIDAYPTTYRRPAVPYHAISIAHGSRLYQQRCMPCHGPAGYGDGPALAEQRFKRADLTARHTGDHTAGDLFWWLAHGIRGTPMPGFSEVLREEERWDLINFLRALAAAEQARPLAPFVEPPSLVAPDFAYRTVAGETQNLKDLRGNVVLLVLASVPASSERLQQLDLLYPQLIATGAQVLVIPQTPAVRAASRGLPLVSDGRTEGFAVYALFSRSPNRTGALTERPPAHMEFLIDRQGYIRARWIPSEGGAWTKVEVLLAEITQLVNEPLTAPAPDDHVH